MEKEELLNLLKESNLKELVEKNINPNKIVKILDFPKNLGIDYYSIQRYIKQNFEKTWNAKQKQWIDIASAEIMQGTQKDNGCIILSAMNNAVQGQRSLATSNNKEITIVDYPRTTKATDAQKNEVNSSQNTMENGNKSSNTEETSKKIATYEEVLSLLNTLEKRTSILEGQLSEIMNSTKAEDKKATKLDTNDNSLADIDEVIKLYTGKKNKRSVNINIELKDKIVQLIYNKYGISDNESLAINIALLLALYKK